MIGPLSKNPKYNIHHAIWYSSQSTVRPSSAYNSSRSDPVHREEKEEGVTMTAQANNLWSGVLQAVIIAAISVACSTILLASKLEERVTANERQARVELASAVAIRKAEQAVISQDVEAQKAVLKDMTEMLKTIANGQKVTQESVARLEERVSYLARGQEDIKVQLNAIRK